jgi:beta-glucosidase
VQLYLGDPESNLSRPIKELKGFTRLELQPGETGTATFAIDMRSLAYFDDLRDSWIADAGHFDVLIGSSSSDIRATARFELTGEWAESAQDAWRSTHV